MQTFKKNAFILSGSFILVVSTAFLLLFLAASNIIQNKQKELLLLEREDEILQIEDDFENVSLLLGQVENYILTEPTQDNLLPYLERIDEESEYITSIYLGRADNTMVNSSGFVPPVGFDLRERLWYQMAEAGTGLIYTPAFINATQDKIIVTMAIPLYVEDSLIGVIGADIDIKGITRELYIHRIGESGFVFLLDGNGNLLSFPNMNQDDISLVAASTVFSPMPTSLQDEIILNFPLEGVKGAIAYRNMSGSDYSLGVFLPMDEFLAVNKTFFWMFAILGFIFLTYGFSIIMGFVTKISRPLSALVDQIKKIDISKDITYKLPVTKKSGFIKVREAINNVLFFVEKEFNQVEESQKKLMEINEKLTASQDRLINAQNLSKIGDWELDLKTNKIWGSVEARRIYGYPLDIKYVPLENINQAALPKYREFLLEKLGNLIEGKEDYNIEYQISQVSTNEIIDIQSIAKVKTNDAGKPIKIIGTIQDVTSLKKMSSLIGETNSRYAAIFNQSPIAIEYYDKLGSLVYVNKACIELFGIVDSIELFGFKLFDDPNVTPEIKEKLKKSQSVNYVVEFDFEKVISNKLYQTTCRGIKNLNILITPLSSSDSISGYIVQIQDLTEQKIKQAEIEYIANHDSLTDLYNRHFFIKKYAQLDEEKYYPLGIMMIDINGLKIINDAYGHAIGDVALKKVAQIFKVTFGENDFVSRIGGDEFVALLPNTTLDKMHEIKLALKENAEKLPFHNIVLSLAIGYEEKTEQRATLDELLEQAENRMYRHKTTEGTSSRNRTISAILATLTDKFSIEKEHLEKVSKTCGKVGKELKLSDEEIKELEQAGMFHDIGKISIPDYILNKPSALTPEEFEIMKTHTESGYQILRAADEYSDLAIHALHHHERWDGTGYPKGLKGVQIPLYSRIIGVVDAYEAMTADRLYRKRKTKAFAVSEIVKYSGIQFDPKIAKIFVEKVLKVPWK